MLLVGSVDQLGMIGQHRHLGVVDAQRLPIRLEMELAVGMAEAVEEMRLLEGRRAIEPAALVEGGGVGQPGEAQRLLDDLPLAHLEAAMLRAQPARQLADHVVVGARLGIGLHHRAGELQIGVAAGGVDVVMLQEGRRRQHDIGHCGGLGHELLVDADEEIVAREALRAPWSNPGRPPSGWCSGSAAP